MKFGADVDHGHIDERILNFRKPAVTNMVTLRMLDVFDT